MSKEKDESVVAKNATAEERARVYADKIVWSLKDIDTEKKTFYRKIASNGHLQGYHSRDTEVAELREALKEIVKLEEIIIGTSDVKRAVKIEEMEAIITKAKQLLDD